MVKNETERNIADEAIRKNEKVYNYRTSQWEIHYIASIFWRSVSWELSEDFSEGDLYVPSYQRDYVWLPALKYKFIESLFLNIPIPYIFINEDSSIAGMEIIDWYQRIRTMYEFVNNKFKLRNLEKLPELNWFWFKDLPIVRQKLFSRKVMNVVIFENLEMSQKQEMFARINTTSSKLADMEKRKWTIFWYFYGFMKILSEEPLFKELCPMNLSRKKREEEIELILRFFAYTEWYSNYAWRVDVFLTEYMNEKEKYIEWLSENERIEYLDELRKKFIDMLNFVKKNFKYGFLKDSKQKNISSRVYFESISVWTSLALNEKNEWDLNVDIIPKLLSNSNYKKIVRSDWANAKNKFYARIDSVKNALVDGVLPN